MERLLRKGYKPWWPMLVVSRRMSSNNQPNLRPNHQLRKNKSSPYQLGLPINIWIIYLVATKNSQIKLRSQPSHLLAGFLREPVQTWAYHRFYFPALWIPRAIHVVTVTGYGNIINSGSIVEATGYCNSPHREIPWRCIVWFCEIVVSGNFRRAFGRCLQF